MASAENNLNELSVIKALQIEGYAVGEARKIVELAKAVVQLGPKQQLIRARDLDENHVGMQIDYPGVAGSLNDIEVQRRPGNLKTAYHAVNGIDPGDEVPTFSVSRNGYHVTTVINSKIVKIPSNLMVKLTENRDI